LKTSATPSRASGAPGGRARALARMLAATVGLAGASHGCGDVPPAPVIDSVRPARAFSDLPVTLAVDVPDLSPGLSIDVGSGALTVEDGSIQMALIPDSADGRPDIALPPPRWEMGATYLVTVPAGIAPGGYDLRITPPSGRRARFAEALQGLGPDSDPPALALESPAPGATLVAGTSAPFTFTADDGDGGLAAMSWRTADGNSGTCALTPDPVTGAAPPSARCTVVLGVPDLDPGALSMPLSFQLLAMDVAGNQATLEATLAVSELPTVTDFENTVGALTGNQAFVVHGRFFLPDAQASFRLPDAEAFLGPSLPIIGATGRVGGDVVDDTTITGFTPPHDRAEPLTVEVLSPAGAADAAQPFAYIAPPRPRAVEPVTGPTAGGILVTVRGNDLRAGVAISFGPSPGDSRPLAGAVSYTADDKVEGCLPPGTGTVSIWAHDPITGDGSLVGAFTYADTGAAGAMSGPPGAAAPSDAVAAACQAGGP
jgi:hypothetical protein